MRRPHSMSGFTMLELALTIMLMATLAMLSYGWYRQEIVKANTAELLSNIDAMRTAFTVEDRSGDQIPDFGYGAPGRIPAALSHIAINEDMLEYPNLKLLFSYSYIQNADDHVFLVLASQNERGAETLRALSLELPGTHFSWMVEPVAAIVPMIGGIHTRHLMSPPTQVKNPTPVTVTKTPTTQAPVQQTPQPSVQQTPQPIVQQTPQPNVQQTPKPQVAAVPDPQTSSSGGSTTTQPSSGGGSSGTSSSGSSGSTNVQPSYTLVPPSQQDNCHGHPNNNGHGHGHAYGHCNH